MNNTTTTDRVIDRFHDIAGVNGAWADFSNELAVLTALDLDFSLSLDDIIVKFIAEDLGLPAQEVIDGIEDGFWSRRDDCDRVALSWPDLAIRTALGMGADEFTVADCVQDLLKRHGRESELWLWIESAEDQRLDELVDLLRAN